MSFFLVALVLGAAVVHTALAASATVTPTNLQGWQIVPNGTVPIKFDTGPGTPPAGSGSLQFGPIDGSNPINKFIMIAPVTGLPVSGFASLSYSFYVDSASPVGVEHMYVNVYVDSAANGLGITATWYDCRYDFVPSGPKGFWNNASFNSVFTGWNQIANALGSCPTSLGALAPGSVIMFFAFNGGQSNASDAGLAGAFDNVTVTTSGSTTWDFEPQTTSKGKDAPTGLLPLGDDRINNYDHGAPVAAYPHDSGRDERGLIVYGINNDDGRGFLAMVVTPEEIAAAPAKPAQNTRLAEGEVAGLKMSFWRLESGLFQLNVIRPSGKTYVLIFKDLIPGGGGYTSFEFE
ncbi:MAG: hypothetical protein ACUVSX_06475 [Aggregatilineales bacterium]